jgi:signal recognition particle receptor subunit beta
MFINWALQEINLKIVYYGPGMSGKTTNLEYIHSKLDSSVAGELVSLKTKEDRTIFFDFLQLDVGRIKGKRPKFNLYTVPGQVFYASSRKIILKGVDGVVFVADSQKERMDANVETLVDLSNNLKSEGFDINTFPWVIQYNKRDLSNIESIDNLQRELNRYNAPHFESVAVRGDGIFDTLKAIINRVIIKAQKEL